MSIRGKDISDDVFDAMREDWRWPDHANLTKGSLAYVLQLAIEHGLVSPPCYCVRWNGEIQTHDAGLMEDMVKLFPGKPWANDCEHWKGQTE